MGVAIIFWAEWSWVFQYKFVNEINKSCKRCTFSAFEPIWCYIWKASKACNPRVYFSLKKLDIFYKDVFTNANGEHLFHSRQQTTVERRQWSGGVKGNGFKLVDVVVEF